MKRKGYIYDRMADWSLIKAAEISSLRNKKKNKGVRLHEKYWLQNLIDIQQMVVEHRMQTSEYKHDRFVSGQGKMRDISKLHFHPSHIEHQLLVMATESEIDKSLIKHTYASRKGYGQHLGALTMNKWIQENYKEYPFYIQFDICKYYDHIPHCLIRKELERRFKDKEYIDAFIEPIERFSSSGVSIPLGIRPSQTFGNLALSSFDRFVKEELRKRFYLRYLDDFVILCKTKDECHRTENAVKEYLNGIGFEIHQPRIDRLRNGLDFLGYVTYPVKGMFWRNSDKRAWFKQKKKVTNKKRIRELDASAWGFLKHGNKYCKRLYKMNGVRLSAMGIRMPEQTDKNGKRVIDAQRVSMDMVLNKQVDVVDMIDDVQTQMGGGRMVLKLIVMGSEAKLIVNANPIKVKIRAMWEVGITSIRTMFIDTGGKHYDINENMTSVLSVEGREVKENENGEVVYTDNNQIVEL